MIPPLAGAAAREGPITPPPPLPAPQLLREADFRYSLVRLRENAESIAFYRGEAQEAAEVGARFDRLIDNNKLLVDAQRNVEFFITGAPRPAETDPRHRPTPRPHKCRCFVQRLK